MTLWPHQLAAVDHALECWDCGHGAMLALEMGTGKTRVAIELLRRVRAARVLVLCPKSVRATWEAEARKWGADQQVVVLDGDGRARVKQLTAALRQQHVLVVTNYESLINLAILDTIKSLPWDVLVFDESHRLKAPSGATSRAVKSLRATRRLALTGTPMPHSPLDIWAQARALGIRDLGGASMTPGEREGMAASFTRFKARYAITQRVPGIPVPIITGWQNKDEITEMLGRFAFQVRAQDVLTLPPTTDTILPVQLDSELRAYLDMQTEMVADLASGAVAASNALDRVLKLQQLTGGSIVTHDDITGPRTEHVGTAKVDALLDMLEDLPPTEPVVVFCRFRADLGAVLSAAGSIGRGRFELSGQRNDLAAWKAASGGEVLAVQIQAGGVGVDLTRARYCVYFSVGHSLGDYLQSRARVHRPGQDRPVHYVHLVATGTIDERVYAALSQKRDVIEEVLRGLGCDPKTVAATG